MTQRIRRVAVLPLLAPVALGALSTPAIAAEAQPKRAAKITKAVRVAVAQVGDPYVYGAAGPSAFDCSGLTSYAYAKAGLRLPRTADQQMRRARIIPQARHRRGDLLFHTSGGVAFHVSMFVGKGGRVVEAAKPGTNVRIAPMWRGVPHVVGTLR